MGKIAFVFSGQGDQFAGMGKDLAESYSSARAVFEACEAIRPGTIEQCWEGSEEELKETRNTQPCLFAMELAAAAVLKEAGIHPNGVAGFSMGEVAAAVAAGLFDRDTGFRLICCRGELMQAAAERQETAMAAVIRLGSEQVEALCDDFSQVYPVNYNCPGQITVAGAATQMTDFYGAVKAAGGRAMPLKVSGAFHSPFMAEAAEGFEKALSQIEINDGEIPLYSNVTAKLYESGKEKDLLARQISRPVRWEMLIRRMIEDGIDTFIEIGPGRTLTNMLAKIDSTVKGYAICELERILQEVKPC